MQLYLTLQGMIHSLGRLKSMVNIDILVRKIDFFLGIQIRKTKLDEDDMLAKDLNTATLSTFER